MIYSTFYYNWNTETREWIWPTAVDLGDYEYASVFPDKNKPKQLIAKELNAKNLC